MKMLKATVSRIVVMPKYATTNEINSVAITLPCDPQMDQLMTGTRQHQCYRKHEKHTMYTWNMFRLVNESTTKFMQYKNGHITRQYANEVQYQHTNSK